MNRTAQRPTQPHSRGQRDKLLHWFHADPPWALRPRKGPSAFKDRIGRVVRLTWRWRDISPGIVAFAVLWLWARLPLPGPRPPTLTVAWLLGLCGALSVASLVYDGKHDRTANKDRTAHQFKRRFQKAWLDLATEAPIPAIGNPQTRPHSVSAWIELVEGTNEWELGRKVRQRLGNIYRAHCDLIPDHKGGALLVIRYGDPLTLEPELPRHLGNPTGPDLHPTWDRLPIGIDRDGDPYTVNLFEQHFLIPGRTRSGKSSTQEAIGASCLAAPNVDLDTVIDPQNVSLAAFRTACRHYAGNVPDALDALEDFHEQMQKRELQMAEAGTSLAKPSLRWPLKVGLVDEFAKLVDPDLQGKQYADRFLALVKDVLNAGAKTGFVLIVTCTNPRAAVLSDGLRDQFTTTLCFRTRDRHASTVAIGDLIEGFKPHELPALPGRAILTGEDRHQLRTYRIWDRTAAKVVHDLTRTDPPIWPAPAPGTEASQLPPIKPHTSEIIDDLSGTGPAPIAYGQARDVIVSTLQREHPLSVREISARTGLSESTVKYHLHGKCKWPIPVLKKPNHRYELAGEVR